MFTTYVNFNKTEATIIIILSFTVVTKKQDIAQDLSVQFSFIRGYQIMFMRTKNDELRQLW